MRREEAVGAIINDLVLFIGIVNVCSVHASVVRCMPQWMRCSHGETVIEMLVTVDLGFDTGSGLGGATSHNVCTHVTNGEHD